MIFPQNCYQRRKLLERPWKLQSHTIERKQDQFSSKTAFCLCFLLCKRLVEDSSVVLSCPALIMAWLECRYLPQFPGEPIKVFNHGAIALLLVNVTLAINTSMPEFTVFIRKLNSLSHIYQGIFKTRGSYLWRLKTDKGIEIDIKPCTKF